MARPRKAENGPSAKDRIETAFWALFEQKPLEKISVKEVCAHAGCNKTTFYYHFQDLREVLDSIEERCLPVEAPDMLIDLLAAENKEAFISDFFENMGDRFEKYCLLLSSRGDPGFSKKAKEVMLVKWREKLNFEYDSLSEKEKMAIRFAMGGSISVLAEHGDGEPLDLAVFIQVVLAMVAPLVMPVAAEMLTSNEASMASR